MASQDKQGSTNDRKINLKTISEGDLEGRMPDMIEWAKALDRDELRDIRDAAISQLTKARRPELGRILHPFFRLLQERIRGALKAQGEVTKGFEFVNEEKEAVQEAAAATPTPSAPRYVFPEDLPVAMLEARLEKANSPEELEDFKDLMLKADRWEKRSSGIYVTEKGGEENNRKLKDEWTRKVKRNYVRSRRAKKSAKEQRESELAEGLRRMLKVSGTNRYDPSQQNVEIEILFTESKKGIPHIKIERIEGKGFGAIREGAQFNATQYEQMPRPLRDALTEEEINDAVRKLKGEPEEKERAVA